MTILEILPYCPKYSVDRRVGINYQDNGIRSGCTTTLNKGTTYLLLGKPGTKAYNIYNVALYDPNIGKVTSVESFELLSFTFSLFLLLCQALVTER